MNNAVNIRMPQDDHFSIAFNQTINDAIFDDIQESIFQ